MTVAGLVLAAGGGRRMGRPKALLSSDGESWLGRAVAALEAGGCLPVVVALGAQAPDALPLVPPGAHVVVVIGWERGVAESLRRGLDAVEVASPDAEAVIVTLVDLPGLRAEAVARVGGTGGVGQDAGERRSALRQAHYAGTPGHPVLLGREHWGPLRAALRGDVGARDYLAAHGAVAVDCTDLGGGDDVDRRE